MSSVNGNPSVIRALTLRTAAGLSKSTADDDKIEALRKVQMPANLGNLETYLDLTTWLRRYVSWFLGGRRDG